MNESPPAPASTPRTLDSLLEQVDTLHPLTAAGGGAVPFPPAFATLAQQPLTIIDIGAPTAEDADFLQRHGLSALILQALLEESEETERELRDMLGLRHAGADADLAKVAARRTGAGWKQARYRPSSSLVSMFLCGGAPVADPFSGRVVVSTHTFSIDRWNLLLRFDGSETFYVAVRAWRGERVAVLLPRLRAIITGDFAQKDEGSLRWTTSILPRLEAHLLSWYPAAAAALRRPRPRVGLQVGFAPNLGHFLWQELAGVERVLDAVGPEAIAHLLLGPCEHLAIRAVFPELAQHPATQLADPSALFGQTLKLPCQVVRPVGLRISRALRARVLASAQAHLPADRLRAIEELSQRSLLLWLNLRSHNKSWNDQVEGYARIVGSLASSVDSLALVLDGWTDAGEVAAALKSRLPANVSVIDTLGCDLQESIVWANAVHLYCSVIGSGLTLNSWLASKPGVAHGNRAHLHQRTYWADLAEVDHAPHFLDPASVTSDASMYGNYDFDWRIARDALLGIVRRHYPARVRTRRWLRWR